MNKKTLTKIMLDIVMASLFVSLIYAFDTGLVFHEIAGLSILAFFASHILLNWAWVKNITINLFSEKLKTSARLRYTLNVSMFLIVATVVVTGILLSHVVFPSLGASFGSKQLFLIHKWASYLCLGLFGIHIVLHGRYLLRFVRKIFTNPKRALLS